jgi:hypothetical protein
MRLGPLACIPERETKQDLPLGRGKPSEQVSSREDADVSILLLLEYLFLFAYFVKLLEYGETERTIMPHLD